MYHHKAIKQHPNLPQIRRAKVRNSAGKLSFFQYCLRYSAALYHENWIRETSTRPFSGGTKWEIRGILYSPSGRSVLPVMSACGIVFLPRTRVLTFKITNRMMTQLQKTFTHWSTIYSLETNANGKNLSASRYYWQQQTTTAISYWNDHKSCDGTDG